MKHYKQKIMIALGATLASASALADPAIVAGATAEIETVKTGAITIGPLIIGVVGTVVLVSMFIMMMRKGK